MSIVADLPAAVTTDLSKLVCTEAGCRDAWSSPHTCRCTTCHGEAHGVHLRASLATNRAVVDTLNARAGGAVARLVAMGGMVDNDTDSPF